MAGGQRDKDDHHDSGAHHPNAHHHDEKKDLQQLYVQPVQRQRWGEAQSLPHTDWDATFMDLLYVAAAYNLGTLIRSDPSWRGLLYFVGLFYPIMMVWNTKMYYESRFCTMDDIYHRMYEFVVLVTLGTAVLYIRPVQILEDPHNVDLFVYSLSTTICHILAVGRIVEICFSVDGQPSAKVSARRDLKWYALSVLFYVAATIVSGVAYFTASSSKVNSNSDTGYGETEVTNSSTGDHHRQLAEDLYYAYPSYNTRQQDTTAWLLFAGSLSFQVMVGIMILLLPRGGKHKEITVPMNIDFCIHRYGAWTMLMLGESVLSLLIVVAPETSDYYETFFSGIISITLLEYLHFRSQPHSAEDHAMRRAKEAGVLFGYLMFIYSGALVILGTCYKMLLYELVYTTAEDDGSSHRQRSLLAAVFERFLAGGDAPAIDLDDRRQRIANMFSGSMAIVFACSDLMILTHQGILNNFKSCKANGRSLPIRIIGFTLLLVRVGMIAFTATLSLYITAPDKLAFVGACAILFQVLLRVIGTSPQKRLLLITDQPINPAPAAFSKLSSH